MSVERRDLPSEAAAVHRQLTDRPYHELVFRVSDTGVGIAGDQIGRIFERFYQVDPARTGTNANVGGARGTGLGLSIVKHAATALGGGVRVESELGKGSTFTLTLPQAAATQEREQV